MARHYIITIGRSFGSCGREIGEKLSKELGVSFYDRNLILMAAKKSGMKMELLESADEKLLNRFLDPYASMNSTMGTTNDRLFRVQSEIIREIAGRESCVIVGRQADKVLAGYDNCTKIFIYAPLERRVDTIMKRHDLNEQEARRLIRRMDKSRKNYYSYFSDGEWDSKDGKDLMIDSSYLGVDGTMKYLAELIRWKYQLQA